MKKIICGLFILVLLSGCTNMIYPRQLETINKACDNNDGIKVLVTSDVFYTEVHCNDGAVFQVTGSGEIRGKVKND